MSAQIPKNELLLTVSDLAVRWRRSTNALYVARHRGMLPPPDYVIDNKPLWKEETIRQAEIVNPQLRRRETM